jgi:predicted transcriptional regulator
MKWEEHAEESKKSITTAIKNAQPLDVHESEIAKITGMNRHTVHKYLLELVKEKKIVLNRKVGKYNFYKIRN